MTLKEAMTYMYQHPYVKMECGSWMFKDKWIMCSKTDGCGKELIDALYNACVELKNG